MAVKAVGGLVEEMMFPSSLGISNKLQKATCVVQHMCLVL